MGDPLPFPYSLEFKVIDNKMQKSFSASGNKTCAILRDFLRYQKPSKKHFRRHAKGLDRVLCIKATSDIGSWFKFQRKRQGETEVVHMVELKKDS